MAFDSSRINVGLNDSGSASSKTTRLQPPGGFVHISHDFIPDSTIVKNSSRVMRPPGGISTIFTQNGEGEHKENSRGSSTPPNNSTVNVVDNTGSISGRSSSSGDDCCLTEDSNSVTSCSPPTQRKPQYGNKMASNFILSDEQPTAVEQLRMLNIRQKQQMGNRRRSSSKTLTASINPLTGNVVGVYGGSQGDLTDSASTKSCGSAKSSPPPTPKSDMSARSSKEASPAAMMISTPTKRVRVPPGGFSTPLW